MKNIVVCFDRAEQSAKRPATNAGAVFGLAEQSPQQLTWYDPGTAPQRRSAAAEIARATVAEAYHFLRDAWSPGDAIFVFGVGRSAVYARELSRLLGAIGIWPGRGDAVLDHLLDTCVLPRTARTDEDWRRIGRIAAAITDRDDAAVPVHYLGLWDAVGVPGVDQPTPGGLTNVVAGRHAMAIDGTSLGNLLGVPTVEEAWFRGAHGDVAGTAGGCLPLADIALDWVLDGAVRAGLHLRDDCRLPSPTEFDAVAASSHHTLSLRRVPEGAPVHASVEIYLRARPQYWRRLPARIEWVDLDWLARGERLVATPQVEQALPVAVRELATATS
ncbi:DUF2235 domain-containing protein [Mycolicibacterium sp. S2-37]|uniref:phospholipase effector Tle1 domain-containing protein n=1 Tax=Mycolicibacterium sp. S2-37 TaxID=2810297 RepID=UPI001A94FFF6|nr:DUF2235 domain-containing protein [Mycolicibacterium sp. S2-37]MBO0679022.1 DUF2235 domain-containing protein [Mycolicibacterium sp. S2-37]